MTFTKTIIYLGADGTAKIQALLIIKRLAGKAMLITSKDTYSKRSFADQVFSSNLNISWDKLTQ